MCLKDCFHFCLLYLFVLGAEQVCVSLNPLLSYLCTSLAPNLNIAHPTPTYFSYSFAHFANNTPPGYAHVTLNHPNLTLQNVEKCPKADWQTENKKGKR